MRGIKSALFVLLTCLVVAGAALVPPQLSLLRDRGLISSVHVEELTGDNNFSVWFPGQAERIELALCWQLDLRNVSAVAQDINEGEWSQAEDAAFTELGQLVWEGILPVYPNLAFVFLISAQRASVWTEGNLGGAGFLLVDLYAEDANWTLSMLLDEESGRAIQLEFYAPDTPFQDLSALEAGMRLLDHLDVDYELMEGNEYAAIFRLTETNDFYAAFNSYDHLAISPLPQEYAAKFYGFEAEGIPASRG